MEGSPKKSIEHQSLAELTETVQTAIAGKKLMSNRWLLGKVHTELIDRSGRIPTTFADQIQQISSLEQRIMEETAFGGAQDGAE